jgi:hypothetical protein
MEQDAVYNNLNNAQTDAAFQAAIASPIKILECPSDPRGGINGQGTDSIGGVSSAGLTWYLGVTGSVGMFPDANGNEVTDPITFGIMQASSIGVPVQKITDGSAYTLMAGERPPSGDTGWGWWAFSDYDNLLATQNFIDIYGGCPLPGVFKPGDYRNNCDSTHYYSYHTGGGNWLYGDASVRFLPYAASPLTLPEATRSGGEVVNDSF